MKRGIVALAMVMALPTMASAQRMGRSGSGIGIFAAAGPALPTGDLADAWDWGLDVGGGIAIPLGSSLQLRGEVNYDRFLLDKEKFGVPDNVSGGDATALTVLGTLKLPFRMQGQSWTPYLLGGGGYMHLAVKDIPGFGGSVSDDRAAAAVGAGADFPLGDSNWAFFVEGRYVIGFGHTDEFGTQLDNENFVPIKIGL
ncbi:MAG TPA: outer membrane beta-barrel protein, partial [Longimicrobiales bacterium]|nr:outer membrane beta-barrel protein [Longimicrobiales bacterium]